MKLRDLNIGDTFKFINYGDLIWIKETEQVMDNQYSYCKTTTEHKRRNTHYSVTTKLFNQAEFVIKSKN